MVWVCNVYRNHPCTFIKTPNSDGIRLFYLDSDAARNCWTYGNISDEDNKSTSLPTIKCCNLIKQGQYKNEGGVLYLNKILRTISKWLPAHWTPNQPKHSWCASQIRTHLVALMADIKKVLLMTWVAKEDGDILLLLWWMTSKRRRLKM